MSEFIDSSSASNELETDLMVRTQEISFFDNICETLESENAKDKFRRAMILILYSHFEGFIKFAFDVYIRHINDAKIKCGKVQSAIATSALQDAFKAFRDANNSKKFLPLELCGDMELRPFAIEKYFVEQAQKLQQKIVEIPSEYVNLESNLKPKILKKNLYRLSLPYDTFENHDGTISKLLNYRNNIAHGQSSQGIDTDTFAKLKESCLEVMTNFRILILSSIDKRDYLTGD